MTESLTIEAGNKGYFERVKAGLKSGLGEESKIAEAEGQLDKYVDALFGEILLFEADKEFGYIQSLPIDFGQAIVKCFEMFTFFPENIGCVPMAREEINRLPENDYSFEIGAYRNKFQVKMLNNQFGEITSYNLIYCLPSQCTGSYFGIDPTSLGNNPAVRTLFNPAYGNQH